MSVERGRPDTNPLLRLSQLGQSLWYDYITRDLVASGRLARLDAKAGALAAR